jgi:hypothetical protein
MDESVIDAMPTKELFVHVLTRDIRLEDAVLDLIDNSIDGAKRLRPTVNERFDDLWVRIACTGESFSIEDNCGGIDVHTAKNYAFRFGRDPKMASTPNSIGQFGVGMKRALLRFGRSFRIESTSETEHFTLVIDIEKWLADREWHFRFETVRSRADGEARGTKILVEKLTEDAATRFPTEEFTTALKTAIESKQADYLQRGLGVWVGNARIGARPFQLLFDNALVPSRREKIYFEESDAPVKAEFIVGVGASSPMEAGWYVACNGRVVLSADQSRITGWNTIEELGREGGLPKYHNQFSRFRGYALFDCIDAGKLPWNTMKTGVDPDAAIFQDARREMTSLMRPVIDFLNRLDAEQDEPEDERPLSKIVEGAQTTPYRAAAEYSATFNVTTPPKPRGPRMTNILYKRPATKVDELVRALGARSAKDAGERSFDEVYRRYVEADDE